MKLFIALFILPGFLFFAAFQAGAQVEEAKRLKTRNNDLRPEEKAVFAVKSHQNKDQSLSLLKNGDQYIVDVSEGGKRLRVSDDFASKADGEFVEKFIEIKYGMKTNPNAACERAFTLFLRGEKQQICQDEKGKIQIVASIVKRLKGRLSLK